MEPEAKMKVLDVLITLNFISMTSIMIAVLVMDEFRIFFNWHLLVAVLPFLLISVMLNRARLNAFEETL